MNEQEPNKKLADRNVKGQFVAGHSVSEANRKILQESMIGKMGNSARHWKKGRYTNSKGYVMVYSVGHLSCNKSGYIPEHRLVAEAFLGRYLTKAEIVHHINGIKKDNRPENLWLYNRREHRKMHTESAFNIVAELYREGKVGFDNGRYFIKETK